MKKLFLVSLIGFFTILSHAQELPEKFSSLSYFIGDWTSVSSGKSGKGIGQQSFQSEMNGQYISLKNETKFEPNQKHPDGEIHIDWGMISFDSFRKKIVYRQFNIEGYVNQFILEHSEKNKYVFTSEAIENAPKGFRARITFILVDKNTFKEGFELAAPGKDFYGCIYNTWSRVQK